jgi:hypothetical protein
MGLLARIGLLARVLVAEIGLLARIYKDLDFL